MTSLSENQLIQYADYDYLQNGELTCFAQTLPCM